MVGKKRFASSPRSDERLGELQHRHHGRAPSTSRRRCPVRRRPDGGCVSDLTSQALTSTALSIAGSEPGPASATPTTSGRSIALCRTQARGRAREVYSTATRRAVALLASVERMSRGMGPDARAQVHRDPFRGISCAMRTSGPSSARWTPRAAGTPRCPSSTCAGWWASRSTAQTRAGRRSPGDVGAMTAEIALADTAGGEYLAETTGGSVARDTNDLAGAVAASPTSRRPTTSSAISRIAPWTASGASSR